MLQELDSLTIIVGLLIIVLLFIVIIMQLSNNRKYNKIEKTTNEQLKEYGASFDDAFRENRVELTQSLHQFSMSTTQHLQQINQLQAEKFDRLNVSMVESLEKVKEQVDKNLTHLQQDNSQKLEQMRLTVDEKLQASVERRFNESFKLISERLDMVQQGLGEMQKLATGVGDLKKVLTNVKTRGNLGEIQLKNILEEILTPQQYEENVLINEDNQRVEFAIKLPNSSTNNKALLLPIDSKFPMEDYHRLMDAYDNNQSVESSLKAFEVAVKKSAKQIYQKYINPPLTTDFAIMFVPTEGLYAEILRYPTLFETLQKEYKITVVGPTNLVAFLSSLHMGFKTLAIEKRSSEVWELLAMIKKEFYQFDTILDKTKKKLQEATNVIEQANTKTRAIHRKLKNVEMIETIETSWDDDVDVPKNGL